ncbi:Haloacid dehalogenase-like hydrolase domain-containing 5, partial [Cichlidogyrus casuarinus]
VCIDLLTTNGLPEQSNTPTDFYNADFEQLPILACNMDLQFKAKAMSPRFGHGAFLLCLEQLYERITGRKLDYSAIIGKPSEITYRYAEHMISKHSHSLGYKRPISKMYFFGDNPEVDILGANLYNNFVSRNRRLNVRRLSKEERGCIFQSCSSIVSSRNIPEEDLLPQTARIMYSVLVHTGVYKPLDRAGKHQQFSTHCHRDFQGASDLVLPTYEASTVLDGVMHILHENNCEFFEPATHETTD